MPIKTFGSLIRDVRIALEKGNGLNPDATEEDLELARRVLERQPQEPPRGNGGSITTRVNDAVLDLRREFQKPYQPPKFVIKGLIPEKEVTTVAGPGGSGKTTFVNHLAASCAIGRDLIEGCYPTRRYSVGVLSLEEDGISIVRMYRDIVSGLALSEDEQEDLCQNIHILDGRSLNPPLPPLLNSSNALVCVNTDVVEAVKSFVLQYGVEVLIVDTVSRSFGGDENNPTHAALYISVFESICKEFDCSTVIIHHSGKGRQDKFGQDDVRGSSVWVDNPRAVLNVRKTPEKELNPMGIPPDEHHRFISVVLAKINHGRPGRKIQMMRRDDGCLEVVQLGVIQASAATTRLAELIRV